MPGTTKKSAPRRTKAAGTSRSKKRSGARRSTAARAAKATAGTGAKRGKGRRPKRSTGASARARRTGALADVSLSTLKAEIDRRLQALQKKREQLVRELEALDAEIAATERYPAAAGRARGPRGRGGGVRKRPRNALNLVEALRKQLNGSTMSVTEVAEAVQKAGYRTTSPNFRTIVNQTLINQPKLFKRVARGRYTAK